MKEWRIRGDIDIEPAYDGKDWWNQGVVVEVFLNTIKIFNTHNTQYSFAFLRSNILKG